MKKKEYNLIVKKSTIKENIYKDMFISFIVGGLLGVIFTFLSKIISTYYNLMIVDGISWTLMIFIFISSILTGLGLFDTLVSFCKCGLIIPITGFSHSVASSILDYKNDGFITGMGSNIFKLAGSVLLYGIVSAYILAIVKVLLCVVL